MTTRRDETEIYQPPVARFTVDGFGDKAQLAIGHRRVRAIELLITESRWSGGIPVSIQDLSNAQMVLMALAENARRRDLTPLEEHRAYAKALEEVKGLTITALAESIGVDRSTLSNNLRILKLPKVVLERVESGEMATSTAREFLPLMNDDHAHELEMAVAIKWIADMWGLRGFPDWRREHVRLQIMDGALSRDKLWRPLDKILKASQLGNRHYTLRLPKFDVAEFKKDHPDQVHTLPTSTGESMSWTCNVREWRRLQTGKTREENRSGSNNGANNGKGKPANQMEELLHKALATDGMLMETRDVSVETAEKHRTAKRAVKKLTPEEVEQLGTRAQPKGIPDNYYNGFPVSLDGLGNEAIPPYFPDIEECLTRCTWGARMAGA